MRLSMEEDSTRVGTVATVAAARLPRLVVTVGGYFAVPLVRVEVLVWLLVDQVLPTQGPRRQVQQFLEAPFVIQVWLLPLRPQLLEQLLVLAVQPLRDRGKKHSPLADDRLPHRLHMVFELIGGHGHRLL